MYTFFIQRFSVKTRKKNCSKGEILGITENIEKMQSINMHCF